MGMANELPAEKQLEMTSLLTEIVDVLTQELTALDRHSWDSVPDIKQRKAVLASRLKKIERTVTPVKRQPADWVALKSRIASLEEESRQRIANQITMISSQVYALQELDIYWHECLSVSFGHSAAY